jgi:hypothetical protein
LTLTLTSLRRKPRNRELQAGFDPACDPSSLSRYNSQRCARAAMLPLSAAAAAHGCTSETLQFHRELGAKRQTNRIIWERGVRLAVS